MAVWGLTSARNVPVVCLLAFLVAIFSPDSHCLHISGSWTSGQKMWVLAKFGFQKTDPLHKETTRGYIYGNVTAASDSPANSKALLVLVNRLYFEDFWSYGRGHLHCDQMMQRISTEAFDRTCFKKGRQDFFRWVPCPKGKLCEDEDNPKNVLDGYQFTYRTEEKAGPGYWYLVLAACQLTASACNWTEMEEPLRVNYDIWLVNGNPGAKYSNPFEHQFSFDEQDTVEVYLIAFGVYLLLALLQLRALRLPDEHLTTRGRLLQAIICMKTSAVFFNLVHVSVYSSNGSGVLALRWIGDVLNLLTESLLVLLLILLAQGWSIDRQKVEKPGCLFAMWGVYSVTQMVLFVWNSQTVNQLEEIDIYETWPGWGMLILRFVLMVWFFLELRRTAQRQYDESQAGFLVHFGAGYLVWFIYLLILGMVASQISLLWRFKILLSIMYLADFLALLVLVHLFWPRSTNRQFFLDSYERNRSMPISQDSLEDYEKALVSEDSVPSDPEEIELIHKR